MRTNYIAHEKNIDELRIMPAESVDLIYADPPFNTGHDFAGGQGGYTDKSAFLADNPPPDFTWLRDVCTPSQLSYFVPIISVLKECHRILKPTGALYWHIDDKTNAHYRLVLNQIFGQSNYRNEIIWAYQAQQLAFSGATRRWRSNTDHILFYSKSDRHEINLQYHPLTAVERKKMYPYKDSKGRKYRYNSEHTTLKGLPGNEKRQYADENKGKSILSCWTDIPIATQKERTGYPTQKPRALLKRIVLASTKEGDVVLDPYCGSGTTLKVAQTLKRLWIGIDANEEAVSIATRRLYPNAHE